MWRWRSFGAGVGYFLAAIFAPVGLFLFLFFSFIGQGLIGPIGAIMLRLYFWLGDRRVPSI
jgi:hypothetical protein